MNSRCMLIGLLSLAIGISSCNDPHANAPIPTGEQMTGVLQKTATHYLVEYSGTAAELANSVGTAGGTLEAIYDPIHAAKVSGMNTQQALLLQTMPGIQFVTPDVDMQWVPAYSAGANTVFGLNGGGSVTGLPADATYFANQWGLRAIKAPEAWTITMGSEEIRVGVLDTGISPTHVDLVGKYDLGASVNLSTENPTDPTDYIDRHFHGTWVAGIISTNNVGIAGVAPNVKLIGIKVIDDNGYGPWANIIAGILYAVDVADCDIINLSLGGSVQSQQNGRLISMFERAVNHARSMGAVVVSAAGNSQFDMDHNGAQKFYPAQAAGSMAVSATGPTAGQNPDGIACYTNYGRSVISVAAPGGNYNCTTGSPYAPLDFIGSCFAPAVAARLGYPNPTRMYTRASGTSGSAPFVSGVVALVESSKGNSNPGYLKSRIEQTADDLGSPGADPYYGKGRVNAYEAVK